MEAIREPTRRPRELAVFLVLVIAAIVPGVLANVGGKPFVLASISTMLHELALVVVVLYFVSTSGQQLSSIGLSLHRAGREIAIGIALYLPMFLALALLAALLGVAGATQPHVPEQIKPQTLPDLALATLLVVVVAFAEEILFRGYLLTRLRAVTRSTVAAIVISCTIFAAGHVYEGALGVAAAWFMGLVFSVVYLWRRSLIAPIVLHFVQDFLALVVASLIAHPART